MRVKPPVAAKDGKEVEVFVAGLHFECDAAGAIALEDEPSIAENPVYEINGRGIEGDNLDPPPQQPLHLSLERNGRRAESRRQRSRV